MPGKEKNQKELPAGFTFKTKDLEQHISEAFVVMAGKAGGNTKAFAKLVEQGIEAKKSDGKDYKALYDTLAETVASERLEMKQVKGQLHESLAVITQNQGLLKEKEAKLAELHMKMAHLSKVSAVQLILAFDWIQNENRLAAKNPDLQMKVEDIQSDYDNIFGDGNELMELSFDDLLDRYPHFEELINKCMGWV